jgi:hypothetical protein
MGAGVRDLSGIRRDQFDEKANGDWMSRAPTMLLVIAGHKAAHSLSISLGKLPAHGLGSA